jgi:hypothetical protein
MESKRNSHNNSPNYIGIKRNREDIGDLQYEQNETPIKKTQLANSPVHQKSQDRDLSRVTYGMLSPASILEKRHPKTP